MSSDCYKPHLLIESSLNFCYGGPVSPVLTIDNRMAYTRNVEIIVRNSLFGLADKYLSVLLGLNNGELNKPLDFIKHNKLICVYILVGNKDDPETKSQYENQMQKRQNVEGILHILEDALSRIGVKHAVIKGSSFERVIYGCLHARDVGDIDILIREEDANRVHKALIEMGYKQQLGPSSGSMHEDNKVQFIAKISKQRYLITEKPIKRFPFKDSYCPYVKTGYPTIEVHDGYRGLSEWYIREVIERASGNQNALVEDLIDVLVLLLLNTYENAESFYSNYFDGKIVLRDFLDIACLFTFKRGEVDWDKAQETIHVLGIEDKVGFVLHDLDELYPGEFDSFLQEIPRMSSMWGLGLCDRMQDVSSRKRAIRNRIREEIGTLAAKAYVGISDASSLPTHQVSLQKPNPSFMLLKHNDCLEIQLSCIDIESLVDTIFVFSVFPLSGDGNPLSARVMIRIGENMIDARFEPFDRITDGHMMWQDTGIQLEVDIAKPDVLSVKLPLDGDTDLLQINHLAISCSLYDLKYENIYWARNRGKHFLAGDVPIGFVSMFTDKPILNVHVDFSDGIYLISTECKSIVDSILGLFENSSYGVPIDVDDRELRSCVIRSWQGDQYEIVLEGELILAGIDLNQAFSFILQDITDWYVRLIKGDELIVHAASCSIGDDALLLMGSSGSGKTTLALTLANWCPLRGDECAKVSIKDGTTWVDPLPINLKADNQLRSAITGDNKGVICNSEIHGLTFSYNRCIVDADLDPLQPKRIRAIVFPEFDNEYEAIEMRRVEPIGFAESVLQSVIGKHLPSKNFSDFVQTVSREKIPLIRFRYSSAEDAANYLIEHIRNLEG